MLRFSEKYATRKRAFVHQISSTLENSSGERFLLPSFRAKRVRYHRLVTIFLPAYLRLARRIKRLELRRGDAFIHLLQPPTHPGRPPTGGTGRTASVRAVRPGAAGVATRPVHASAKARAENNDKSRHWLNKLYTY